MEIIENINDEYNNYFDTNMFLQNEELNGLVFMEMARSGYYGPCSLDGGAGYGRYHDSSSPDGGSSSPAPKNIVSERNRRKKLTERLLALREVVPKITKLDKASIIRDAIDYIQDLLEQERRIQAELKELESEKLMESNSGYDFEFQEELPALLSSKKRRIDQSYDFRGSTTSSPIEVLELGFDYMREKILLVRLKCVKKPETMVKLCEVFESLKLKIIMAKITTVSGLILKTVFIEADEEERDHLKMRIDRAIAALTDTPSLMNM